tara:strand:- start:118 stop:282 length:165 start_codon:yes stop_codon:yes gene_type:complete
MTREIIDSIAMGSNLEAEAQFDDSMINKVGKALESKRKELSNTFVNHEVKNEEN